MPQATAAFRRTADLAGEPHAAVRSNVCSPGPQTDLPRRAEGGLLGFDVSTWFGIFAPTGTPPTIVARLKEAFAAALRTADVRSAWRA